MGRKKNDDVWNHFNENKGGVNCNFCQKNYKVPNVTKMKNHLISCLHCPDNIKSKMKGLSVDEKLAEKVSDALVLAGITTESASPNSSRASTPQSSRASTPQPLSQTSSRPSTPNFPRFVDRMTDKENVSFAFCL